MKFAAVLLMGGDGLRFGGTTSKLFLKLGDKFIYEHALDTLITSELFDEIVVVSSKKILVNNSLITLVTPGGSTRQESSYKGLLGMRSNPDFVIIHDGARPFLSIEILERNIDAVVKHNAVNTCIPSHDTINYIDGNKVCSIPDRSRCVRGQTPQSFSYELILQCHKNTTITNASDDCSLIMAVNHPIYIVDGNEKNVKITTPIDFIIANQLLYTNEFKS